MKTISLGWGVIFTTLATIGSAIAQDREPGAVTHYKDAVSKQIAHWARNMEEDNRDLQKVAGDWRAQREILDKAIATRLGLEKAKQDLENSKQELEKKLDDLKKDYEAQVDPVKKGADLVVIGQITEEIKKKTTEISKKADEIKKAADDEKKADADVAKKKPDVASVVKTIGIHKGDIDAVVGIPSPVKEDEKGVLAKDTKGNYRVEWGPRLAQFILEQINTRKQNWTELGVTATVEWPQSAFANKSSPKLTVSLKLPDVDAKPAVSTLHMR